MKLSLKLREEKRPLWRAKVPITILGLPFLSGLAAGETRELRLDLATAFESGPALRLSYCPNDPSSPFSLTLKTGTGAFGSPAAAPVAMSAEFSLLGRTGPAFRLLLKPRLGDFSLRRIATSSPPSDPVVIRRIDAVDPVDGGVTGENGTHHFGKANGFLADGFGGGGGGIDALISGTELSTSSALPLRGAAAVKLRWGVRIPAEIHTAFNSFGRDGTAGISLGKLPGLVMSKISVERVAEDKRPKADASKNADHVAAWLSVRRQLEALHTENGLLRRAVEELRSEGGGGKPAGFQAAAAPSEAPGKDATKQAEGAREPRGDGKPVEKLKKASTGPTRAGK